MSKQQLAPLSSTLYDHDYFLSACEGYQEFLSSEGQQLSRRLDQAISYAQIEPGMRVLDVASGRGEIVRYCAQLGADAYGIDFASVANQLARQLLAPEQAEHPDTGRGNYQGKTGILQGDAKLLPFPARSFDRVLMFDIVEHLHPWELQQAFLDVSRVLKDDGRLIIHTAPNRWYDRYAYPIVRAFRILSGNGAAYPRNPREIIPANLHVHVNEQDMLSLPRALRRANFSSRVWLDSPPQNRQEGPILAILRYLAFELPPLRWFFEREVFAIAAKQH